MNLTREKAQHAFPLGDRALKDPALRTEAIQCLLKPLGIQRAREQARAKKLNFLGVWHGVNC